MSPADCDLDANINIFVLPDWADIWCHVIVISSLVLMPIVHVGGKKPKDEQIVAERNKEKRHFKIRPEKIILISDQSSSQF